MSDTGLSHRLRQRSRRAGLMIGLTMILTIAVCAMGFTLIYSALDGVTSDFISRSAETPTPAQVVAQNQNSEAAPEPDSSENTGNQEQNQQPPEDDAQPAEDAEDDAPPPTEPPSDDTSDEEPDADEDDGFDPDYQLQGVTVNLRAGPSRADDIVTALPPSTPLQYLDEDAPTTSAEDGDRWMRFTTEDGLEGWIREIDVTDYQS